jgi:hypothetical protein
MAKMGLFILAMALLAVLLLVLELPLRLFRRTRKRQETAE